MARKSDWTPDPQTVAHHEAAHAVALLSGGLRLQAVTMNHDGGSAGDMSMEDKWDAEERPREMLVVHYAGAAASRRLGRESAAASKRFAASDYEAARLFMEHIGTKNVTLSEQQHRDLADAFVEQKWSTIRAVAAELLERGALTPDEIRSIINRQGGK